MIELYIDDKRVDLLQDIDINITYSALDVSKPTAIKNYFSKTIKIPGTPNNNSIFGDIWRIDRLLIDDPIKLTGVNFDSRRRVPFTIIKSGAVVESGYMQLNNININNHIVSYDITLYGGLGDFFYNLMYNEDGTEKTLYDMYWLWKTMDNGTFSDNALPKDEEDFADLYSWNAKSIAYSWSSIKPFMTAGENATFYFTKYRCTNCGTLNDTDTQPCSNCGQQQFTEVQESGSVFVPKITRISNDITAIPTYNGMNDDFSLDKVLVSKNALGGGYFSNNIKTYLTQKLPISQTVDSTSATTFGADYALGSTNSYGLLTAARDLDPHEAKDMRVKHMNIGLRFQKFLERISDPVNNGGYTVEWDENVLKSPYYGYTWLILGQPDFAETITAQYTAQNDNVLNISGGSFTPEQKNLILKDGTTVVQSINVSGIDSPQVTLKYRPIITTTGNLPENLFNHYGTYIESGGSQAGIHYHFTGAYWPVLLITTHLKTNGTTFYSKTLGLSLYQNDDTRTPVGHFGTTEMISEAGAVEAIRSYVDTHLREGPNNDYYDHHLEKMSIDGNNILSPELTVSKSIPSGITALTIENRVDLICVEWDGHYPSGSSAITAPTVFKLFGTSGKYKPAWNANNYTKVTPLIMTSSIGNIGGTSNINYYANKRALLGNTKSPYKYLTDFTKLLNLRYVYDKINKKIKILPIDKYYHTDTSEWVDADVDLSKEIKMNAQAIEYKTLTIDLDNDKDCYPVYLYNKSYNQPFASKIVNTGNEFTDKNLDLFDGSIYKESTPYRQSSIYYDRSQPWLPSPARQNNFTWSLFSTGGDTYICDSNNGTAIYQHDYQINSPAVIGTYVVGAQLVDVEDLYPKIAQFDKDDKYLEDTTNTFVFLNGYVRNWDHEYNPNTSRYDTRCYYGLSNYMRIMSTLTGNECYLYEYTNNYSGDIPGAAFANSVYPFVIPNFSKNLTSRFVGNVSDHSYYGNYWWPYLTNPSSLASFGFWASWYINKPIVEGWPEKNVEFMTNCSTLIQNTVSTDYVPSYTYNGQTMSSWRSPSGIYNRTDDSIYTRFWKNYLNDLYDKTTKEITLYMSLNNYTPEEAMRRIWVINGTAFVIIKIFDYSAVNKQKFIKVTLRKVTDIENYKNVNYSPEEIPRYFEFVAGSTQYNTTVDASATTATATFTTNYASLTLSMSSNITSGTIDVTGGTMSITFDANTSTEDINSVVTIYNGENIVGVWNITRKGLVRWAIRSHMSRYQAYVTLTTDKGMMTFDLWPYEERSFTDTLPLTVYDAVVVLSDTSRVGSFIDFYCGNTYLTLMWANGVWTKRYGSNLQVTSANNIVSMYLS